MGLNPKLKTPNKTYHERTRSPNKSFTPSCGSKIQGLSKKVIDIRYPEKLPQGPVLSSKAPKLGCSWKAHDAFTSEFRTEQSLEL